MLKRDIEASLVMIAIVSLVAAAIGTALYMICRKPVVNFYRRNFDKQYRYSSSRTKRR